MDTLRQWIGNNFVISELIAVVMVIGGAAIAFGFRERNRWGWVVLLAGVALGAYTLHVQGLV